MPRRVPNFYPDGFPVTGTAAACRLHPPQDRPTFGLEMLTTAPSRCGFAVDFHPLPQEWRAAYWRSEMTQTPRSSPRDESRAASGGRPPSSQGGVDQAQQKVSQVVDQAQGVAGQVAGQAKEQATSQLASQKDRAVDGLVTVAQALHQTGQTLQQQEQSTVAGYVVFAVALFEHRLAEGSGTRNYGPRDRAGQRSRPGHYRTGENGTPRGHIRKGRNDGAQCN